MFWGQRLGPRPSLMQRNPPKEGRRPAGQDMKLRWGAQLCRGPYVRTRRFAKRSCSDQKKTCLIRGDSIILTVKGCKIRRALTLSSKKGAEEVTLGGTFWGRNLPRRRQRRGLQINIEPSRAGTGTGRVQKWTCHHLGGEKKPPWFESLLEGERTLPGKFRPTSISFLAGRLRAGSIPWENFSLKA